MNKLMIALMVAGAFAVGCGGEKSGASGSGAAAGGDKIGVQECDDYIAKMLNAIIGVRISIVSIEGIAKLSQNRPEGDRAGVLNGFTHSHDHAARQLAAEMTKKVL